MKKLLVFAVAASLLMPNVLASQAEENTESTDVVENIQQTRGLELFPRN